jgi:linoleoyl-CoA desaturase
MSNITYKTGDTPFYNALKTEVEAYFRQQQTDKLGDARLYLKGIAVVAVSVYLYVQLVFFTPSWWLAVPLALVLGFALALIGMNVMHDGCHGSYSKNRILNDIAGYTLNFLGSDAFFWKLKHNISHHTYTNIETADDDIESNALLRFAPSYPRNVMHRYQHLYAPLLYCFAMFSWVWITDFQRYFSKRVGTIIVRMKPKDHVVFWFSKAVHIILFIVLPIWSMSLSGWVIGYSAVLGATGLTIAFVFLLAHLVEKTEMESGPDAEGNKAIAYEWAEHQIRTTADFATNNRVLSWLLGGLNYQVVHHLFPRISHVHYPALQPIVARVCAAHGVEYRSYPTMVSAIGSHLRFMKAIGRL